MATKPERVGSLSKIGGIANAEGAGAENTAYDPATKRLFVSNTEANSVDVISLADPTQPEQSSRITMPAGGRDLGPRRSWRHAGDGAGKPKRG